MTPRILIAGIGNVFLGDDGFGVEVVRTLDPEDFPPSVRIADYGISGMHLAYDLLSGYETTILIDAVSRGEQPGTLLTIELDTEPADTDGQFLDGHGMQPDAVMRMVALLGGTMGRTLLIGCEPADLGEHMGLSDAVAGAVPHAHAALARLVSHELDRLGVLEV